LNKLLDALSEERKEIITQLEEHYFDLIRQEISDIG
jgi:hypothetical protein